MADPYPDKGADHRQDRLRRGTKIALLLVAVTVQLALCLPSMLANRDRHLPWWPEPAMFAFLTALALLAAHGVALGRRVAERLKFAVAVVTVLGADAASAGVPADRLFSADDWSFGLVGWYIVLLLIDFPVRVIGAFIAAHVSLSVVELFVKGVPDLGTTAPMVVTVVSVCGFQLASGLAMQVFLRAARAASVAAAQEDRVRTREAIAEHTHRDHRARYVSLLGTTVPLLAGLANSTLDPLSPGTRRRCAVEAARMRQLFAEGDDVPDELVHELRAGIDVAQRRGVAVQVSVLGKPAEVPLSVRRGLIAPVSAVLAAASSRARVTVMRAEGDVRVSVVADAPESARPSCTADDVEVSSVTEGEKLWVETVWRRQTSR